jgi:hypothetical protein
MEPTMIVLPEAADVRLRLKRGTQVRNEKLIVAVRVAGVAHVDVADSKAAEVSRQTPSSVR